MQNLMEKFGSFGAILAAMACPICFPKLALIGALVGMGALAPYETAFFFAAQILVVLSLVGHFISYKKYRNVRPLILATVSTVLLFVSLYALVSEILSYIAFGGLIIATVWQIVESRRCTQCATA